MKTEDSAASGEHLTSERAHFSSVIWLSQEIKVKPFISPKTSITDSLNGEEGQRGALINPGAGVFNSFQSCPPADSYGSICFSAFLRGAADTSEALQ